VCFVCLSIPTENKHVPGEICELFVDTSVSP
jgi:hypothetical protein